MHMGTLPPRCPPAHARTASGTRVRRLFLAHARPALVASPRWPSCWCAPRGRALTQEPCGITFQTLARREKRPQRTSDRSGTAVDLQERSAIRRAPSRGLRGGRKRWHKQSAAAPVLTAVPQGGRIGEARRSVRSSALPSRQGVGTSPGSPARGRGSPAAAGSQPCTGIPAMAAAPARCHR